MIRKNGWQIALADAVRARLYTPFSYGGHDCSIAAADCVLAMTGVDLMQNFRGKYRSAAGAARLLRTEGNGTLVSTISQLVVHFGGREVPVLEVCKGDLVLTEQGLHDAVQGQAAGIWLDSSAIFPATVGWTHLSRSDLSNAFRIG